MREERVLERIENLRVPRAWEDARIAGSPSAKVQATGYDPAGRLQYRYHGKYRQRKEREEFERILASRTGSRRCGASRATTRGATP